mmetsp:Transcript_98462/g.234406  ORF Transcript_98462/g.234406 Transcript_98462/m.234406 type:complete len:81 (-) Transcript_98462:9-251(-)
MITCSGGASSSMPCKDWNTASAASKALASFSFGSFALPRRELQCEGFREGFSELACEPFGEFEGGTDSNGSGGDIQQQPV